MQDERGPRSGTGIMLAIIILLIGLVAFLAGRQIEADYGEVLREAGLVIIGTVLVTYCYEFVLRRQHDAALLTLIERRLVGNAPEFGLLSIARRPDFGAMFDQLSAEDELLWLDTYCPVQRDYQGQLVAAVQRGAHIKMLAIDPDCVTAGLRANEIAKKFGYNPARFTNEARGNLENFKMIFESVPLRDRVRVEVRLYDDLPCAPLYIRTHRGHPQTAFSSYFLSAPSFDRPHIEWGVASGGFLEDFYAYFQSKWERHESDRFDLGAAEPENIVRNPAA